MKNSIPITIYRKDGTGIPGELFLFTKDHLNFVNLERDKLLKLYEKTSVEIRRLNELKRELELYNG